MNRFEIEKTPIPGLQIIQRQPIGDDRGYLERLFCSNELTALSGNRNIVQINHTLTKNKGTVRGLHFQHPPHAEMKLVSCLRGEIFDVAVDLRKESPTFLQYHAVLLSEDNHQSYLIPEGFAHGFQTLTEECELLYFHTAAYAPEAEAGVNALDPLLAIQWPLNLIERSVRDQQHPFLDKNYPGLSL